MAHFSVGELVTIRFGKHQGQKGTVITNGPTDAYKVKVQDGTVLFFSGKGLEKAGVASPIAPTARGNGMAQSKTLQQRQGELQLLLADSEGRKKLQEIEACYASASGKHKPPRESIITYILVHERAKGLIKG